MDFKPLPDASFLRQLLEYDPETGQLRWRARPIEMFAPANGRTAENCQSVWNSKYAGKVAGCKKEYVTVKLLAQNYPAHRLIWKMVTGRDPKEIDHINRNKHDNRWSNIRSVDHSTNQLNRGRLRTNTSGHRHITWSRSLNRWVVQLRVPGKGQRQVAYAKTIGEAVDARNRAYLKYGYAHFA